MSREGSLTLDRGLALLQAVAEAGSGAATISELAATIGASRAAVYRLLIPLSERGLVWRDGSKVRLGAGVLKLAGNMLPQLRKAAQPILRELAEQAQATAFLAVAEGDYAHVIAVVEPTSTNFHVAYRVGSRHRLGEGAVGKALSAPVLRALRGSERGWVYASGELRSGLSSIAAPVRGVPGLRASVGVVSLGKLDQEDAGPQTVSAATKLSEILKSPS